MTTIQFRRGTRTTANSSTYVAKAGEPVSLTDENALVLGDGTSTVAQLVAASKSIQTIGKVGDEVARQVNDTNSAAYKAIVDTSKARESLFVAADYGAKGDGTTDDTTALANALAAARGKNGVVSLRSGATYIVASTLTIDGAVIAGNGATIKAKAGAPAPNIFKFGAGGGAARDLTIDLNKANTTDPGATKGSAFYTTSGGWGSVFIERVTIKNGYQLAIGFANWNNYTDARTVPSYPIVLRDVVVTGCAAAVAIYKAADVLMDNVQCYGATGTGIFLENCLNPRLNACISNGSTTGSGFFTQYCYGLVADKCVALNNSKHGFAVGGGSTTIEPSRSFVVSRGTFRGNGQCGITCDLTKDGAGNQYTAVRADGKVSENDVQSNGLAGIQIEFTSHVSVVGNLSAKNGTQSTSSGSGIRATGGYLVIEGNILTENYAYGLMLNWASNLVGVGYHRIGQNVITENTSGQIYTPAGTGTDPAVLPGTTFAATTASPPSA